MNDRNGCSNNDHTKHLFSFQLEYVIQQEHYIPITLVIVSAMKDILGTFVGNVKMEMKKMTDFV